MKIYKTEEEAMKNGLQDYGFQEEFDGKNCNDFQEHPCDGWNGHHKRCVCGNRRVYWEPTECDGGFYVRAVAW